jgi:hypothetical protein
MSPLKHWLVGIGLAASGLAPAPAMAVDFVCEFKAAHTLVGDSPEALQSQRSDNIERYVITIPEECKPETGVDAKYLNVSSAWVGSGVAFCVSDRATFVETTISDNLFILSVFSSGHIDGHWLKSFEYRKPYPALMSVQVWQPDVKRHPETRTGYCRRT